MNFSLADLQAFIAVAERSNFRAAAEAIHVSQPALSRRIAKLEGALEVRLFERDTHHVILTMAGREFERRARPVLHQLQSAVIALGDPGKGAIPKVRIACITSAVRHLLVGALVEFQARHPRHRIEIVDGGGDVVLDAVRRGRVDFGLSFSFEDNVGLDFRPLMADRFVAICRRGHRLARRKQLTWAELGQHDYLSVSRDNSNRRVMDNALVGLATPTPRCEVRHLSSLLGLVEAGAGVAAVPRSALPATPQALVAIALVDPIVTRAFGTVRRIGLDLPPAAQTFDAFLADWWRRDESTTTL